ncbi:hypothetical protein EIN_226790 [Entamoeba invadens IP1]|uniref:Uncharacterized protein n=1 Tax=Entamoeba invadens IP1 TaxID=370355 RepID=A0A0A1U2J3_ENTIV|nr:hypothetical protein EIN_226790 [Entamoeba invadens IP1]ELP88296.1 hypothetical protein EIN_226790 [Entamoeba invadens IP1]|eukprot:XP_004255067.1 hypothetical protein EIN_226790 [Entamoeba invadens IP1]
MNSIYSCVENTRKFGPKKELIKIMYLTLSLLVIGLCRANTFCCKYTSGKECWCDSFQDCATDMVKNDVCIGSYECNIYCYHSSLCLSSKSSFNVKALPRGLTSMSFYSLRWYSPSPF